MPADQHNASASAVGYSVSGELVPDRTAGERVSQAGPGWARSLHGQIWQRTVTLPRAPPLHRRRNGLELLYEVALSPGFVSEFHLGRSYLKGLNAAHRGS